MEIRAQMLDTVVLGLPVRAGIRMVKLGVEVVHQSVAQFWITCGVVGIAHDKAQKANVRLSAKTMSDVHAMAPREYQTCDPITDIAICVAVIGGNNFMVPLPRETARVGDVRQAMARRGNSAATESYFMYAGRCLSDKFLLKQFEGPEMTVFCMPFSSYTGPAPLEQAHTSWADVYNLFETLTERKPRFRSPLPPGVARPTL